MELSQKLDEAQWRVQSAEAMVSSRSSLGVCVCVRPLDLAQLQLTVWRLSLDFVVFRSTLADSGSAALSNWSLLEIHRDDEHLVNGLPTCWGGCLEREP